MDVAVTATWERRLQAEWKLLGTLARLNPERIAGVRADDAVFRLTLRGTPAFRLHWDGVESTHALRVVYPRFFPMAPLELYLETPVIHPNIHPETGFVCLWDRHRVSNNVEHALHKTVAMLGWRLWNADPLHVMQPECLLQVESNEDAKDRLRAPLLCGVEHPALGERMLEQNPARRSRLS